MQLVYTDAREPEVATIVREGDIVLMPKGYHPNVAAPGGPINFLWMMAAIREDEDRQYGVVNVHPDFAALGRASTRAERRRNEQRPTRSPRSQHRDWSVDSGSSASPTASSAR